MLAVIQIYGLTV